MTWDPQIQGERLHSSKMSSQMKELPQVKAICGVLFRTEEACGKLFERIATRGWEVQHRSMVYSFDMTTYYTQEMGTNLNRFFLSLNGLFPQMRMVSLKNELTSWEKEWSVEGQRTLNLDPGYLDLHRVVLLSSKEGPHKIHLQEGVWADLNLLRKGGNYQPLSWTFPDLQEERYSDFFEKTRKAFKQELREARRIGYIQNGNS